MRRSCSQPSEGCRQSGNRLRLVRTKVPHDVFRRRARTVPLLLGGVRPGRIHTHIVPARARRLLLEDDRRVWLVEASQVPEVRRLAEFVAECITVEFEALKWYGEGLRTISLQEHATYDDWTRVYEGRWDTYVRSCTSLVPRYIQPDYRPADSPSALSFVCHIPSAVSRGSFLSCELCVHATARVVGHKRSV